MRPLLTILLATGAGFAGLHAADQADGVTNADKRTTMTPEKGEAPVQPPANRHLLDRVIPAYGVLSLRPEKGAIPIERLAQEIAWFASDVQFRVTNGSLGQPVMVHYASEREPSRDDLVDQDPLEGLEPPQPVPELATLTELREALEAAKDDLLAPTHREKRLIERSYIDLDQAETILYHGLSAKDIERIENQYKAWLLERHIAALKARRAAIERLQQEDPDIDGRDVDRMIRRGEIDVLSTDVPLPTDANALEQAEQEWRRLTGAPDPEPEPEPEVVEDEPAEDMDEADAAAEGDEVDAAEESDTSSATAADEENEQLVNDLLNDDEDVEAEEDEESVEIEVEIEEIPDDL